MSALGKVLIAIAAVITLFCFLLMFTDYLQPPTHRLGADPGFHGAMSTALIPIFIVFAVAVLSLIFWPKRR